MNTTTNKQMKEEEEEEEEEEYLKTTQTRSVYGKNHHPVTLENRNRVSGTTCSPLLSFSPR